MENTTSWYAIYTAPRAEKKIKQRFDETNIENYLPLRTEIRIWSDRKKKITVPLISGYIFVRTSPENFLDILKTPGVVAFLKEKAKPVNIPDNQMHRLRQMVEYAAEDIEFSMLPIEIGDTVRVKQGDLSGLIGELIAVRGKYKIAIRLPNFGCALTTIPLSYVEKMS